MGNRKGNDMEKNRLIQRHIHFYEKITDALEALPSEALFVVDENIFCLIPEISSFFEGKTVLRLKVDEGVKTLQTVDLIYEFLFAYQRTQPLVAIGGGITGDLTLYAAATFKRGIPMIMVPTTLLSMVDSAVGGKCGVNYQGVKNYIGAFKNPDQILISPAFLDTLDVKEMRCGMGELIKTALLGEKEINQMLKEGLDLNSLPYQQLIEKALLFKIAVVERDFRDENYRNILNFGHNTAHGLETLTRGGLTHGEAVGLGILVELALSEKYLLLPREVREDAVFVMNRYGMMTKVKVHDQELLYQAMEKDKKNDMVMRFTLLQEVGKPIIKIAVKKEDIFFAFNEIME